MRPCDEAKAVQRMPRSSADAGKSHGVSMAFAELTWPRRRLDPKDARDASAMHFAELHKHSPSTTT